MTHDVGKNKCVTSEKMKDKSMEYFHMTSQQPYLCFEIMKQWPCSHTKPILWELNSFLMSTPFWMCDGHVPENAHIDPIRPRLSHSRLFNDLLISFRSARIK